MNAMDLRALIIERIRMSGSVGCPLVLDVFYYLTTLGASPEDAANAMTGFVDEAIAIKKSKQHERPPMGH
jgi:hypothetical protein